MKTSVRSVTATVALVLAAVLVPILADPLSLRLYPAQ